MLVNVFHDLRTINMIKEETGPKTPEEDELAKKWESSMFEFDQPIKNYVVKDVCIYIYIYIDLSDDDTPSIIIK